MGIRVKSSNAGRGSFLRPPPGKDSTATTYTTFAVSIIPTPRRMSRATPKWNLPFLDLLRSGPIFSISPILTTPYPLSVDSGPYFRVRGLRRRPQYLHVRGIEPATLTARRRRPYHEPTSLSESRDYARECTREKLAADALSDGRQTDGPRRPDRNLLTRESFRRTQNPEIIDPLSVRRQGVVKRQPRPQTRVTHPNSAQRRPDAAAQRTLPSSR